MCHSSKTMFLFSHLLILLVAVTNAYIPTYDLCHGTIVLTRQRPAAELKISSHDFTSFGLTSVSMHPCSIHVVSTSSYSLIGVLLKNEYNVYQCNNVGFVGCPCNEITYFDMEFDGGTKRVCSQDFIKAKLDTKIDSSSLNVTWLRGIWRWKSYSILLFRFTEHMYCDPKIMMFCGNSGRCIPDSLICEPPYTFCGDGSSFCPYHRKDTTLARTTTTTARTTTATTARRWSSYDNDYDWDSDSSDSGTNYTGSIFAIIGVVCGIVIIGLCCCSFAKSCQTKPAVNNTAADLQQISTITNSEDSSTVPRGPTLREISPSVDNTEFNGGPPVYEMLEINVNAQNPALVKDDLPPSYDMVMSNAQEYKVDSSVTSDEYL